MESVKIEKSLKYSDFVLNGYSWLWQILSHHLPEEHPAARRQYHPVTRGGTAKPVVLLTHGGTRLRYFSVTEAQHRIAEGEYIAYTSLDDTYPERLAETTAWMLGALVLGVANDANGAKTAEARAMEILSAL